MRPTNAKTTVLLDTGPLVGLYNEKDDWHSRCKAFLTLEERYEFILTQAVIGEVIYHVQKDKHAKAASRAVISLLELIEKGPIQVHELSRDYISRLKQLQAWLKAINEFDR